MALSLFLLVGTGLLVRSLQNLRDLDTGFDRDNVLLFSIDVGNGYDAAGRARQRYRPGPACLACATSRR